MFAFWRYGDCTMYIVQPYFTLSYPLRNMLLVKYCPNVAFLSDPELSGLIYGSGCQSVSNVFEI